MIKALITVAMVTLCQSNLLAQALFPNDSASVPDIETFMQIGWSTDGAISPDGKMILFQSSFTQASQLFRLTPEGWPYQLTTFKDGVDWYVPSRDYRLAIVGSSSGGNERSQLFLLDLQTGRIRQLTHSPEVRYGSVVWAWDGMTIYFQSNKTNGEDLQVWKMNLVDGNETLVQDKKGKNGPLEITRDGRFLLTYSYSSNVNNDFFILDLQTGKETHLTPHVGDVSHRAFSLMPDGLAAYLVSNGNADGISRLARLDIATKQIQFIDSTSKWEYEGCTVSDDGNYLAWRVNELGYSRVYLKDLQTGLMLASPPLDGTVSSVALTDVKSMLFGFNSPTKAPDLWLWKWETKELTQITHSTYAGIDPSLFTEPKLVKYQSFDKLEITAFLFLPPGYAGGKIPFVIEAHGGPESQFRPSFSRHFQYLILNGFGVLAVNPRGSSGYGREFITKDDYKKRIDAVKDYAWGAKWLIKNGYTSESMLGIKGGSYGGYVVLASLTEYPNLYRAGFSHVGIANFISFLQNTEDYRRSVREAEYGPLSDTLFLSSISPINKVDKIKAALMLVHGENDPRVPVDETRQIIRALEARGVQVDSLIFHDEGHSIEKLSNRLTYYRKMVDFFSRYLKQGS
jgi:dipeptidyl aminopeptidase/acylaminoacyl peptidase